MDADVDDNGEIGISPEPTIRKFNYNNLSSTL